MIDVTDAQKTLLIEQNGRQNKIREKWRKQFGDISTKTSLMLESQYKSTLSSVSEMTSPGDIGGFVSLVLPIVSKVLPSGIFNDIISVQPILTPSSMVFYYDPKVDTTHGNGFYQSLFEAHTGNSNYNISLGEQTAIAGTPSGVTTQQYYSGESFTLPYVGGQAGLSSLEIMLEYDQTGLSGQAVDITASILGNISNLFNDNSADMWTASPDDDGWIKVELPDKLSIINGYSVTCNDGALPISAITICASTNSTDWVLLDSQTPTFSSIERIEYSIPEVSGYKYYQFDITGATTPLIYEMELLGHKSINYTMNPQTWTENLFKNDIISVNGVIDQHFLDTKTAYTQHISYADNEAVFGMQEVQLNIVSSDVLASSRKLKSSWTQEMEQNLLHYAGLNMPEEISSLMASEIAVEIDRMILRDLINIAPHETSWNYNQMSSVTRTDGYVIQPDIASGKVTQKEWNQTLGTEINRISGLIMKNNYNKEADWIVCSTKVGTVIGDNVDFIGEFDNSNRGIKMVGTLSSKYHVYVDPYLPDEICLIGTKGINDYDCGYIYSPYVTMVPTEKIMTPDKLFEWKMAMLHRSGKKVVNNKKYGLIRCQFDGYDIINGD